MNTPWIIGTIAALSFFAYFEWRAFKYPTRQNTLSRWIYNMGQTWPLSIFLMGMMCGGLAVHFFWHWDPACGTGVGLLETPISQVNYSLACRPISPGSNEKICAQIEREHR